MFSTCHICVASGRYQVGRHHWEFLVRRLFLVFIAMIGIVGSGFFALPLNAVEV
jgi:hypothetical protein